MVQILQVFGEDPGNESSVDHSKPFDWLNFSPCLSDSPNLLPRQARLLAEVSDILFIITRSKNSNVVAYRYTEKADPIEAFWQRFADFPEPETDMSTLHQNLSWIQKKMAFGISSRPIPGTDQFNTTLVACPTFPMTLAKDAGRPRLQLLINGRRCFLLRIYVEARENLVGYPTVIFTNIHAIDISTGREIVAKIKP